VLSRSQCEGRHLSSYPDFVSVDACPGQHVRVNKYGLVARREWLESARSMAQHAGESVLDNLGVTAVDATDVEQNVLAQVRDAVRIPLPYEEALLLPMSSHLLHLRRVLCCSRQATGGAASAEQSAGEQSPEEQRRDLRRRLRAVEREAAAVQTVLDR